MLSYLFVLIIGLITGFMDAIIGCGGLISIPMLIFAGMPPSVAVATDRFGCLGSALSSTYRFWKSELIVKKYLFPFSFIAVVGALVGASILININEKLLGDIIGILLILLLPVIFIRKDLGIKNNRPTLIKISIGYIIFFLIEIYAGLISIASGIFVLLALSFFFGMDFLKANATLKPVSLLGTIVALLVFANNGIVDWVNGLVLFLGMLSGGYLGAVVAEKGGNKFIRYIFILVVIFSAEKLLLY